MEEAQAIVGGYVELLTLPNGNQMLVDEDGVSKGREPNTVAQVLTGGVFLGHILGDALVLVGEARWD